MPFGISSTDELDEANLALASRNARAHGVYHDRSEFADRIATLLRSLALTPDRAGTNDEVIDANAAMRALDRFLRATMLARAEASENEGLDVSK